MQKIPEGMKGAQWENDPVGSNESGIYVTKDSY